MKRLLQMIGVLVMSCMLISCGSAPTNQTFSETDHTSSANDSVDDGSGSNDTGWVQITQEEAARIIEEETGYLILDVRRPDEYADAHIPGAINIPNENIGTEEITELPEKDQTLLVYCRSGRRSKESAEKLAALGYSDVREFGGIIDWAGETVSGEDAFGAAWEPQNTVGPAEAVMPRADLVVEIGNKTFYAEPEDNSSGEAFIEQLTTGSLTVEMHDYGGFEKVGPLPFELPTNDEQITTQPGDVILYQGNQITIYYDENTWNFTRIAKISGVTKESLLEALGDGDVTVTFRLEWSE